MKVCLQKESRCFPLDFHSHGQKPKMLQIHFRPNIRCLAFFYTHCWHPLLFCWRRSLYTKWVISSRSRCRSIFFRVEQVFSTSSSGSLPVWRLWLGKWNNHHQLSLWQTALTTNTIGPDRRESPVWPAKSFSMSKLTSRFHTSHENFNAPCLRPKCHPVNILFPLYSLLWQAAGSHILHGSKSDFCCQGNSGKVGKQLNSVWKEFDIFRQAEMDSGTIIALHLELQSWSRGRGLDFIRPFESHLPISPSVQITMRFYQKAPLIVADR